MLGLVKKGGVVEKEKEELKKEASRYRLWTVWERGRRTLSSPNPGVVRPHPTYPRHQRNSRKIREKKEVKSEGLVRMTEFRRE